MPAIPEPPRHAGCRRCDAAGFVDVCAPSPSPQLRTRRIRARRTLRGASNARFPESSLSSIRPVLGQGRPRCALRRVDTGPRSAPATEGDCRAPHRGCADLHRLGRRAGVLPRTHFSLSRAARLLSEAASFRGERDWASSRALGLRARCSHRGCGAIARQPASGRTLRPGPLAGLGRARAERRGAGCSRSTRRCEDLPLRREPRSLPRMGASARRSCEAAPRRRKGSASGRDRIGHRRGPASCKRSRRRQRLGFPWAQLGAPPHVRPRGCGPCLGPTAHGRRSPDQDVGRILAKSAGRRHGAGLRSAADRR